MFCLEVLFALCVAMAVPVGFFLVIGPGEERGRTAIFGRTMRGGSLCFQIHWLC